MSNENWIKITNDDLNNPMFANALMRLNSHQLPFKTAYRVSHIWKQVQEILKESQIKFGSFLKEYAKVDENGNIEPELDKDGNPIMGSFALRDDVDKDEYQKKLDEFLAVEHEIKREKMDWSWFEGVNLSGNDISALEPLLCGLGD